MAAALPHADALPGASTSAAWFGRVGPADRRVPLKEPVVEPSATRAFVSSAKRQLAPAAD